MEAIFDQLVVIGYIISGELCLRVDAESAALHPRGVTPARRYTPCRLSMPDIEWTLGRGCPHDP